MEIKDRVMRIAGSHSSGMGKGDIATVIAKLEDKCLERDYVLLKEYPGKHNTENFIKINDESIWSEKKSKKIDFKKFYDKKINSVSERDIELEKLISEREALTKKIDELQNLRVELNSYSILKNIMENEESIEFEFFREKNSIICEISEKSLARLSSKGTSTCMPCDKYSEDIGSALALYRALSTYYRKKASKLVKNTY